MKKWAVIMDLPDNKQPGFYAQVIKALASQSVLYDRDKEVLILNASSDVKAVSGVLQKYGIPWEEMPLILLPEGAETTPAFDDYGFVSHLQRAYLYADMVSVFRFAETGDPQAERTPALLQMEEHLLARFPYQDHMHYAVDGHLAELIERIAAAYRCRVEFGENAQ